MAFRLSLAGGGLLPTRWVGAFTRDAIPPKRDDGSPDETAPLMTTARLPSPTRSPPGSGLDLEMVSGLSSAAAVSPVLPAPASSSPDAAATGPLARRMWPFWRLGDVFGTWPGPGPRNHRMASTAASSSRALASHVPAPSAASPVPGSSSTYAAPRTRRALGMWPFAQLGDVFGAWRGPRPSTAHVVAPVSIFVVGSGAAAGQDSIVRIPINFTLQQGPQFNGTHRANFMTTVVSQEKWTDWMKLFRDLLLAFVFFTLPIILVFFPRFDQADKNDKETHKHAPLAALLNTSDVGAEKYVMLTIFVLHATFGLLGVLLAHIGRGSVIKNIVGTFTLGIIISVMGFVDYILWKTVPDNSTSRLVFLGHFIAMAVITCLLWFRYVGVSCLCKDVDDHSQEILRPRLPV